MLVPIVCSKCGAIVKHLDYYSMLCREAGSNDFACKMYVLCQDCNEDFKKWMKEKSHQSTGNCTVEQRQVVKPQ
jgi:hypothetical protein